METVMVTSKYEIAIPRALRKALGIKPGEKFQVIQYGNRIELIPLKSIKQMRGFLKGIDTTIEREPDRV
jgi:AbrB family looped-hinge helix DNA binding protein